MDASDAASTRGPKIRWLCLFAQAAAAACFVLLAASLGYTFYLAVCDPAVFDSLIVEDLLDGGSLTSEQAAKLSVDTTLGSRCLVGLLESATLQVSLYAVWVAWRLFSGYRRGEILTTRAAKRLSTVGWAVAAMGPVSIVSEAASSLVTTSIFSAGEPAIEIDNLDIFALVMGLLVAVVGRILLEASLISDENKAFV